MKYTTLEITVGIVALIVGAFMAWSIFIYAPVDIYTKAKCLEKGYAGHKVSFGLSRYCTTLDGAVTVKVEKL